MLSIRKKTFIFAGPSIALINNEILKYFEIRPPIQRNQLENLLNEYSEPQRVVIIDGIYGSNLTNTPRECRWLLQEGWELIGCSSLGALRASELWPVGMIGVGEVYNLFRLNILKSDADVAVAYDQNNNELTISMVLIRKVIAILLEKNILTQSIGRKLLKAAQLITWYERGTDIVIEEWANLLNRSELHLVEKLLMDEKINPKKTDALQIINMLTSRFWTNENIF